MKKHEIRPAEDRVPGNSYLKYPFDEMAFDDWFEVPYEVRDRSTVYAAVARRNKTHPSQSFRVTTVYSRTPLPRDSVACATRVIRIK